MVVCLFRIFWQSLDLSVKLIMRLSFHFLPGKGAKGERVSSPLVVRWCVYLLQHTRAGKNDSFYSLELWLPLFIQNEC
jgi:hypothetical protein